MIETRRLKTIIIFFQTAVSFVLSRKFNIAVILIFFAIHANLCAQKSWKRTCAGFEPATPLMQPIRQLQWTDTKATSEKWKSCFLENTKMQ